MPEAQVPVFGARSYDAAMNARDLQELVEYSSWATRRTLEAAGTIPSARFTEPLGGGFASLRDVLVHGYGVDGLWLARSGWGARTYPDHGAFPDLATLASAWQPLLESQEACARGWSDAQVGAVCAYVMRDGTARRSTVREIVLHCVNHASYHRGQAMTRVRRLGGTPLDTGFATFRRALPARPTGATVAELVELLDYSAQATMATWIAARESGPACWTTPVPGSFTCLRDLLHHLAFADAVWLRRVLGHAPHLPAASQIAGSELVHVAQDLAARWRAHVAALGEAQLDTPVRYRTLAGAPAVSTLREIVQHLVNHATNHRGQIAQLMRELGAKPASTDLITFFHARAA